MIIIRIKENESANEHQSLTRVNPFYLCDKLLDNNIEKQGQMKYKSNFSKQTNEKTIITRTFSDLCLFFIMSKQESGRMQRRKIQARSLTGSRREADAEKFENEGRNEEKERQTGACLKSVEDGLGFLYECVAWACWSLTKSN